MKTVIRKSSSLDPSSKKHVGNKHAPSHLSINSSLSPIYNIYIKRKPICPCDGGCPRCAPVIQPKLIIGQPDDKYEQEADRVADEVMRMPEPEVQPKPTWPLSQGPSCGDEDMEGELIQTRPVAERITPLVQRQLEEEDEEPIEELKEEEEPIMTKAISNRTQQASDSLHVRLNRSRGGGQPLPDTDRDFMETRFGVDFSSVKVHTDSNAIQMSRKLNAQAFTHGRDVYFGAGRYNPGTSSGKRLLAHELTHAVQQGSSTSTLQQSPLTEEERQKDLQSEKYAGNHRLQKAYDNNPPMRVGETGEAVRLVQEGLVADGIILPISTNKETGEMDGIFGQETYRGVQEFQYKYAGDGLLDPNGRADGIIGRNTMGKLDELARQRKTLPICPDRDQFSGESVSGPQPDQIVKSLQPSSSFLIILGLTCQLGQPPGKNKIEPQNPSKPNDLKKYKCARTKEFRVHIYAHSSHWLKVREQFNACVDALNPYNIIINIDRLDSIPPTTPQTWIDFCELARDAFKAYPPHKDSLPVFVLKLGQQQLGKGNHGRKWTRDECSYLKVYLPKHIEDFVAIDVKTPLGSTMLHEIGHAVLDGSLGNDHDSALKDPENIMFVPGDLAVKRRFLWHKQLRRFCNAQF